MPTANIRRRLRAFAIVSCAKKHIAKQAGRSFGHSVKKVIAALKKAGPLVRRGTNKRGKWLVSSKAVSLPHFLMRPWRKSNVTRCLAESAYTLFVAQNLSIAGRSRFSSFTHLYLFFLEKNEEICRHTSYWNLSGGFFAAI